MANAALKGIVLGLSLAACGGFVAGTVQAEEPSHVTVSSSLFALEGARVDAKLTRVRHIGKAPMVVSAGVRVYVPAAPGLSRELLTRMVTAEAQRGTGPLAVENLGVAVRSAGDGYYVELTSQRTDEARALYDAVNASLSP